MKKERKVIKTRKEEKTQKKRKSEWQKYTGLK